MVELRRGRWTHDHDGDVVVFLIGMRVNRLRSVGRWLPVARAFPQMMAELTNDPASGYLGGTQAVLWRGTLMVQYWRDLDSLIGYAHDTKTLHRPAWKEFNRRAKDAVGAVGIWHETYLAKAGQHESIYVEMPARGIIAATRPIAAERRGELARDRMAG
jgi:poly(3-hydroxybutyrate) depolymerase